MFDALRVRIQTDARKVGHKRPFVAVIIYYNVISFAKTVAFTDNENFVQLLYAYVYADAWKTNKG